MFNRDASLFDLLLGGLVVLVIFAIVVVAIIGCVSIVRSSIAPDDPTGVDRPVYIFRTPPETLPAGIDTGYNWNNDF
jgi:hypothetical protein